MGAELWALAAVAFSPLAIVPALAAFARACERAPRSRFCRSRAYPALDRRLTAREAAAANPDR